MGFLKRIRGRPLGKAFEPCPKRDTSQALLKKKKNQTKQQTNKNIWNIQEEKKRFGIWRVVSPIKLLQRVGKQMQESRSERQINPDCEDHAMQQDLKFIL